MLINFPRARIPADQHGQHRVRPARIRQREQRARARHHAVTLVLAIRGVRDLLCKRIARILQRAHHRRVYADVQRLQPVGISRRVHQPVDRFCVGTRLARRAHHRAVGLRDHLRRARGIIHQLGRASLERGVELPGKRIPVRTRQLPLRQVLERLVVEAVEKLRVYLAYPRHHLTHHGLGFRGRVARPVRAPQPVQHDAGKCVHHGGKRGHGEHVARHFERALFRLLFHFVAALRMGHRPDVPDVGENRPGIRDEKLGDFAVGVPGPPNRRFVDGPFPRAELCGLRRHVSARAVHLHVALRLLLGVIERMRVQERPDELPAHVFQAEFEVCVLKNGVMPGVKRGRADGQPLFLGNVGG